MSGDEPTISWPELVVLMAYGHGHEDVYSGELRMREVDPVDDETSAEDIDGRIETHPALGRVAVHESVIRAYRRGELLRVESVSGEPLCIVGRDKHWMFEQFGAPVEYDRATAAFGIAGIELLERWPASRWEGADFTRLTGPITATEFHSRRAWTFELAPPSHKPYPLQVTVDAATGLVLRQANADFGSYQEWTDLQLDADLPDELFVWDGPSKAPETHEAEHERDMAGRRAWLASRGVRVLLPLELELMPHVWDDESGAFEVSFMAHASGSLLRRCRSEQPWPEAAEQSWTHLHRWHDERWDWFLGTEAVLDEDQLAALRSQLARSR